MNHKANHKTLCIAPRCCAEVGNRFNGWHECGRRASIRSIRALSMSVYRLYFCKRHEKRARIPESDLVRIVRVQPLDSTDYTEKTI